MPIAGAHNPVNLTSIPAVPERKPPEAETPVGRRRWLICGFPLFATTVNYMDRQVIALLKPTLQVQFGWTENDYGTIIFAFTCAYAVGILFIGKLIDRLGTRKGARRSRFHDSVRSGARWFGTGRGWQFSGRGEGGGGVVSEARARAGHGLV